MSNDVLILSSAFVWCHFGQKSRQSGHGERLCLFPAQKLETLKLVEKKTRTLGYTSVTGMFVFRGKSGADR
jgi:hypothetical protein